MGRPRVIKSVAIMAKAWEAYKADCDNRIYTKYLVDKDGIVTKARVPRPKSYKIIDFVANTLGISYQSFQATYKEAPEFSALVNKMETDCHACKVQMFEDGDIDGRLAGLLLSPYGYTTKTEAKVETTVKSLAEAIEHADD